MKVSLTTLRQKIQKAVAEGTISVRSRAYFILKSAAIVVGVLILVCVAIYAGSFFFFIPGAQHTWLLTNFGWRGYVSFFLSLPWVLFFLAIILVVIIEIISWKFTRLYRRPILYSFLTFIIVVSIVSAAVAKTTLHRRLFESANRHHLPMVGGFYKHFGMRQARDIHFGEVLLQGTDEWNVRTTNEGNLRVIINDDTRFPINDTVAPHDYVVIFGPRDDDYITAHGIHKILPEMIPTF